jgi:hypothetical protein
LNFFTAAIFFTHDVNVHTTEDNVELALFPGLENDSGTHFRQLSPPIILVTFSHGARLAVILSPPIIHFLMARLAVILSPPIILHLPCYVFSCHVILCPSFPIASSLFFCAARFVIRFVISFYRHQIPVISLSVVDLPCHVIPSPSFPAAYSLSFFWYSAACFIIPFYRHQLPVISLSLVDLPCHFISSPSFPVAYSLFFFDSASRFVIPFYRYLSIVTECRP